MIFPEAMKTLENTVASSAAVKVPILANLTEFGPRRFYADELAARTLISSLYCCGAYRAMNKAALNFYETVRREGTQKNTITTMQTREELYDFLGYHAYEDKLDALFAEQEIIRHFALFLRPTLPRAEFQVPHQEHDPMSEQSTAPKAEEIRRAFRRGGRQYRTVHGRPQR
jgi:hypothetical protein